MCYVFRDCCEDSFDSDKFRQYIDDPEKELSESEYDYMLKVHKYSECINIKVKHAVGMFTKILTIKVINRCPSHYDGDLRAKCFSNLHILNILTHVKFGIYDLIFRNPYCALCHGYQEDDIRLWTSTIYCPPKYVNIPKHDFQQLSKHCELVHTFKEDQKLRYCVDPIASLKFPEVDQTETAIDHILCNGYISILLDETENIYFRNKHCALSAQRNLSTLVLVAELRSSMVINQMGMNIMFHFTGIKFEISGAASRCYGDFTFDPITKFCANLICPDGFIKKEQLCVYNDPLYKHTSRPKALDMVEGYSKHYVYLFNENFILFDSFEESYDDSKDMFDDQLNAMFLETNISTEVYYLQNFLPNHPLFCNIGRLETLKAEKFTSFKDGYFEILHKEVILSFYLPNTRFSISAKVPKPNSTVEFSDIKIFLCIKKFVLNCSTFLTSYESNDYEIMNNKVYFKENVSVILDSAQYKIIDSKLYICHTDTIYSNDNGKLDFILTVLFFSLSLMCILPSIVLQIMVRGIQTCPAKCFLSYSITWFTAQFSFILAIFMPSQVCSAFALTLHYLWLCIFSWSSVLAFDLVKTLNACTKTFKRDFKNNSLFVKYSIAGWGLPLLVVVVSNVVDYVSLTSFDLQYGNQNICWIGNVDAVLLTFVLPTGTSTFFNVVCLGVSLHGLEIAKRNSKYLQKTKKDKQRWLMFLQMFIMCGGSWVLAYAASNVPFELLKVTNIVLNGCQGIYILIITTKDSKVKRWLAVQMKRLRTRSTTSSGPQTNSTDNVNNIKNTKL